MNGVCSNRFAADCAQMRLTSNAASLRLCPAGIPTPSTPSAEHEHMARTSLGGALSALLTGDEALEGTVFVGRSALTAQAADILISRKRLLLRGECFYFIHAFEPVISGNASVCDSSTAGSLVAFVSCKCVS